MQNLKNIALFISLVFTFQTCSNKSDENYFLDLLLEEDVYAVFINTNKNIPIISGNGAYSISISDPSIVSVEYIDADNVFKITGLKIGETDILIKDDISMQEKKLKIAIIETHLYLSLKVTHKNVTVSSINSIEESKIYSELDSDKFIEVGDYITIIPSFNVFYKFATLEDAQKGEYKIEGNCQLIIGDEVEIKYLQLEYDNYIHKYPLNTASYNVLRYFLQIKDTDTFLSQKSTSPTPFYMLLEENRTDYYTTIYPDLITASLSFQCLCIPSSEFELPGKLL